MRRRRSGPRGRRSVHRGQVVVAEECANKRVEEPPSARNAWWWCGGGRSLPSEPDAAPRRVRPIAAKSERGADERGRRVVTDPESGGDMTHEVHRHILPGTAVVTVLRESPRPFGQNVGIPLRSSGLIRPRPDGIGRYRVKVLAADPGGAVRGIRPKPRPRGGHAGAHGSSPSEGARGRIVRVRRGGLRVVIAVRMDPVRCSVARRAGRDRVRGARSGAAGTAVAGCHDVVLSTPHPGDGIRRPVRSPASPGFRCRSPSSR